MKKDALIIAIFLFLAYPLIVVAAHYSQSYMIFRSRGPFVSPPGRLHIFEVILFTHDGERLNAWWLQTMQAKKTVLYFQENGANISFRPSRLNTFHRMGVNGLLIDYRGYGKSTGRIKKERDIYTDGVTAWNYLTIERKIDPRDIIVWGRSLGGGVATEIAQHRQIAALVLESSFNSLDDIARRKYWYLPTKLLLKFHFDNGGKLKNIVAPVIIIHSVEDDYIPFAQAIKLFDSAPDPKYLIKTMGSHLDLFESQNEALSRLMGYLSL